MRVVGEGRGRRESTQESERDEWGGEESGWYLFCAPAPVSGAIRDNGSLGGNTETLTFALIAEDVVQNSLSGTLHISRAHLYKIRTVVEVVGLQCEARRWQDENVPLPALGLGLRWRHPPLPLTGVRAEEGA